MNEIPQTITYRAVYSQSYDHDEEQDRPQG